MDLETILKARVNDYNEVAESATAKKAARKLLRQIEESEERAELVEVKMAKVRVPRAGCVSVMQCAHPGVPIHLCILTCRPSPWGLDLTHLMAGVAHGCAGTGCSDPEAWPIDSIYALNLNPNPHPTQALAVEIPKLGLSDSFYAPPSDDGMMPL